METNFRHGCVNVWLWFVVISSLVTCVAKTVVMFGENNIPDICADGLVAVLSLGMMLGAIQLFRWNKMGFYLLMICSILSSAVSMTTESMTSSYSWVGMVLGSLLATLIWWGILQIRKDGVSAWSQMRDGWDYSHCRHLYQLFMGIAIVLLLLTAYCYVTKKIFPIQDPDPDPWLQVDSALISDDDNSNADSDLWQEAEKARKEKEAAEKAAEKARKEKEAAEKAAEKARKEKEAAEKAAEKPQKNTRDSEEIEKQAKEAEKARKEKEAAETAAEKARKEKEAAEKARKEKKAAEKARKEKESAEKATSWKRFYDADRNCSIETPNDFRLVNINENQVLGLMCSNYDPIIVVVREDAADITTWGVNSPKEYLDVVVKVNQNLQNVSDYRKINEREYKTNFYLITYDMNVGDTKFRYNLLATRTESYFYYCMVGCIAEYATKLQPTMERMLSSFRVSE